MITTECRLLVRQLVLEEHQAIRHVARILGMARNTVKRCLQADTDQPRRDTRSQAGRFLVEHPDEVRNSFYTCKNCGHPRPCSMGGDAQRQAQYWVSALYL